MGSAVEASLELEKKVHESLLEMHKVADSHGDAQLTDFIEGEYLKEQVEAQKEIGDLITKMKRAGDALGLHIIDKEPNKKSKAQIAPTIFELMSLFTSIIIHHQFYMCSISSASLVKL